MISLEQVQLLESRVSKAISFVERLTSENAALASEKAGLQVKLEANQKRLDELEVLIMRFKEDQGRIEDGIIAALDRLSQFEEAFENSLKDEKVTTKKTTAKKEKADSASADSSEFFEITQAEEIKPASSKKDSKQQNKDGNSSEFTVTDGELDIF